MQGKELDKSVEIDNLVNEILDLILTRKGNGEVTKFIVSLSEIELVLISGMRPPTVPVQLMDAISQYRGRPYLAESVIRIKHFYLNEVSKEVRKNTTLAFEKRKESLSPIDHLKQLACNPIEYPTEATLVAKMFLHGTYETQRDHKYATLLLLQTAEMGNSEASYLLATAKYSVNKSSKEQRDCSDKYLIDDPIERRRYLLQARKAGFQKVFDDEFKVYEFEDYRSQLSLEDLIAEMEHDSEYLDLYEEYLSNNKKSKPNSPHALLMLAKKLLKLVGHVCQRYPELITKSNNEKQRLTAYKNEACQYLQEASKNSSEAKYLLAQRYVEDSAERFDLLLASAYPSGQLAPFRYALSTLACDFFMNQASQYHDPERGLRALNQYLAPYLPIELDPESGNESSKVHNSQDFHFASQHEYIREDNNAALCLADHLINKANRTSSNLAQAYIWYSAVGIHVPNASYAALRAGLMVLRGEGCEPNIERAKTFFSIAKISRPSGSRDVRAKKYADIALRLGFESFLSLEIAIEQLLEIAEETNFEGDEFCLIQPEDVVKLTAKNPGLKEYRLYRQELLSYPARVDTAPKPYGFAPDYPSIAQGLIWVHQRNTGIPRDELAKLWYDEFSMFENYVWARLELSGRLIPADQSEIKGRARDRLNKVGDLGAFVLASDYPYPMNFSEKEAAQMLTTRAYQQLSHIEEINRIENKAKLECTKREVIENMLAMFAHKLRGPIDSILFNTAHQHDERIYIDAAQTMNGLMDMASAVSTSPDRIANNCQDDMSGNGTPQSVLVHSLKQSLVSLLSSRNRLRMSPHYMAYAKKRGAAPADLPMSTWMREKTWVSLEEEIQSQWADDMSHLIVTADIEMMTDWMAAHLLPLSVQGFDESHAQFSEYGLKASLLTVIFQEMLVNAIKHSAPGEAEPIRVSWLLDSGDDTNIVFACANPSTLESRRREKSKGSGRGHKFLALLAEHLRGRLTIDVMKNDSRMLMSFPRCLFEEDRK